MFYIQHKVDTKGRAIDRLFELKQANVKTKLLLSI